MPFVTLGCVAVLLVLAVVWQLERLLASYQQGAILTVRNAVQAIGITAQNLSVLKTGRARALRFSTLEAICRELRCQPGELLEYRSDDGEVG